MKIKATVITLAIVAMLGGSVAYGASSLIGAKVQGIFNVEVNGNKIADAIVVNGQTYVPVRSISESAGMDLTVEGKKVVLKTRPFEDVEKEIVTNGKLYELGVEITKREAEILTLTDNINSRLEKMETAKKSPIYSESGIPFESSDMYKRLSAENEADRATIKTLTAEISTLQAEKDALLANK